MISVFFALSGLLSAALYVADFSACRKVSQRESHTTL